MAESPTPDLTARLAGGCLFVAGICIVCGVWFATHDPAEVLFGTATLFVATGLFLVARSGAWSKRDV